VEVCFSELFVDEGDFKENTKLKHILSPIISLLYQDCYAHTETDWNNAYRLNVSWFARK